MQARIFHPIMHLFSLHSLKLAMLKHYAVRKHYWFRKAGSMQKKERDRQQHTTGHRASSPSRPGSPGSPFSPLKPRKPCSWNQSYKHPVVQLHWPLCSSVWLAQSTLDLRLTGRDLLHPQGWKLTSFTELEAPSYCVQQNHIPVSLTPEKQTSHWEFWCLVIFNSNPHL